MGVPFLRGSPFAWFNRETERNQPVPILRHPHSFTTLGMVAKNFVSGSPLPKNNRTKKLKKQQHTATNMPGTGKMWLWVKTNGTILG